MLTVISCTYLVMDCDKQLADGHRSTDHAWSSTLRGPICDSLRKAPKTRQGTTCYRSKYYFHFLSPKIHYPNNLLIAPSPILQQLFIEHVLKVGHCAKCWGYVNRKNPVSSLKTLTYYGKCFH